jgi:hypothetical protein
MLFVVIAFASAFNRQKPYLPAAPSLVATHFSAGDRAWDAVAHDRIPAASHTPVTNRLMIASP